MKFKKITSMLAIALTITATSAFLGQSVFAAEKTATKDVSSSNSQSSVETFKPSAKAVEFTKKMFDSGLIKEFEFDKNRKLILKHSLSEVKAKYKLDDAYIKSLQKVLDNAQKRTTINSTSDTSGIAESKISVSNWKIYLTNDDVKSYLFAAAAEGPVAMDAALEALGTLTGGPAGTVVATIFGYSRHTGKNRPHHGINLHICSI